MTTSQARGIKQDGLNDLNVQVFADLSGLLERNGPLLAKLRLRIWRDAAPR